MARLKNRARPVQETVGEIPDRFYDPLSYFESHGPMTPSAVRAYVDDLKDWLESECGVSVKASPDMAIQVMSDLNTLPAAWLDHAARAALGYQEWEPWEYASVEETEPVEVESGPTSEAVVTGPPVYQVKPNWRDLIDLE